MFKFGFKEVLALFFVAILSIRFLKINPLAWSFIFFGLAFYFIFKEVYLRIKYDKIERGLK